MNLEHESHEFHELKAAQVNKYSEAENLSHSNNPN